MQITNETKKRNLLHIPLITSVVIVAAAIVAAHLFPTTSSSSSSTRSFFFSRPTSTLTSISTSAASSLSVFICFFYESQQQLKLLHLPTPARRHRQLERRNFIMIHTLLSGFLPTFVDAASTGPHDGQVIDHESSTLSSLSPSTTSASASASEITTTMADRDDERKDRCPPSASSAEAEVLIVEGIPLPNHKILPSHDINSAATSDSSCCRRLLYKNGHGVRSINFFGMDIKIYVASLYTSTSIHTEDQIFFSLLPPHEHHSHSDSEPHHRHHHHSLNPQNYNSSNVHSASSPSTVAAVSIAELSQTSQIQHMTYSSHHGHNLSDHTGINTNKNSSSSDNNPVILQLDFTFLRYVNVNRVVSAWTQQLDHSVTHRYDGYEADRETFIKAASSRPIEKGGTQSVVIVGDTLSIVDQGENKADIKGHNFQKAFLSMWFGDRAVASDIKAGLLQGHQYPRKDDTNC